MDSQDQSADSHDAATSTYAVNELADATGVSVDTVRYYQSKRLLDRPARVGRKAVYDESHVAQLEQIQRLADQGFTLAQIRKIQEQGESPDADPALGALVEEPDPAVMSAEEVFAQLQVLGVPPDAFTDLASRHVQHVERLADAAVALYRFHVEPNPDTDPAAQDEAVQLLLPAISALVANHFTRTLSVRLSGDATGGTESQR